MRLEEELKFYQRRLKASGPTAHGVGWAKGGATQAIRFAVIRDLAHVAPWEHLLDAGCGVGQLLSVLPIDPQHYVGVDRVPQMITHAQRLHPDYIFRLADLRQYLIRADIVVASGIFSFCEEDQACALIRHLFGLARRVLVFNALTEWGPRATVDCIWSPIRLFQFCSSLTQRLAVRHDYLPADMTLALFKEPYGIQTCSTKNNTGSDK